jgi:hypothetical protein
MDDGFASMHLSMGYVALSVGFSCAHNTMLLSVPKLARESGACMHGGNKKEKKKNPVEPKDFTMTAASLAVRAVGPATGRMEHAGPPTGTYCFLFLI